MDTITLVQLSAIPAALGVLGSILVTNNTAPEAAGRRMLVYLLAVAALCMLAAGVGPRFWKTPYDQAGFLLSGLLQPLLAGVLALIVMHIKWLRGMSRWQVALSAALLMGLALLGFIFSSPFFVPVYIMGISLALAVSWHTALRSRWLMGLLLSLALVTPLLFNDPLYTWIYHRPEAPLPGLLMAVFGVQFYLYPVMSVTLAAVLIFQALKPRDGRQRAATEPGIVGHPGEVAEDGTRAGAALLPEVQELNPVRMRPGPALFQLAGAALLLAGLAYTIYWTSIWDQTSDGIGGVFLAQFGALAGIGAGMLMMSFARGWNRAAGLLYLALAPILVSAPFHSGWQVSYHELTEQRAARIAAALERYHARQGTYPQSLDELAPRDLLFVPPPVIFRGEPWCYQANASSYRLGAVFREYFSLPLSIQVYEQAGEPPEEGWACDARLEELKARYEPSPSEIVVYPDSEPEPQPQSEVPVERQALQPLVSGDLLPGSWSPDGQYFSFVQEGALQLLDVSRGQVCATQVMLSPFDTPQATSAWLPDGLLVITLEGELVLQEPCGEAVLLEPGATGGFKSVLASDQPTGRLLLEGEQSFWIFESQGRTLRKLEGVTPNPYEAHWDNADWLPGSGRLAISRLDGRDNREGSTLFIVDGDSGQAQLELPLEFASDQSAPRIDWLSKDELLLNGGGALLVIDLRFDPPQLTDVMGALFGLDLAYPDEISSMAWVVDRNGGGYYLALRANHPRNQALYLYHSASGETQVLPAETNSLLFFPDGQVEELSKLEIEQTYADEYELIMVSASPEGEAQAGGRLKLEGHTPRSYPHLFLKYQPATDRLYAASSQGVSLVSLPGGEMLAFWDLGGRQAYVSGPDGAVGSQRFLAIVNGKGLFLLPDVAP